MPSEGGLAMALIGALPTSLRPDQSPMARGVNERQHLIDQRLAAIQSSHRGESLCKHTITPEQIAERTVQQLHLRLIKTAPLQADHIQPSQPRAVTDDAAERNNISLH